jgi:hypothetical protein
MASYEHPGLHRRVRPLDLRHVHEAGRAADQRAAGKGQCRDRLQAALVQRARAIADAPPALEMLANLRVGLEPLHLLERGKPWIAVIQPDHETVRNEIITEMVKE